MLDNNFRSPQWFAISRPTSPFWSQSSKPQNYHLRVCLILICIAPLSRPAFAQRLDEKTEARVKKATSMVFTLASKRKRADTPMGSGTGYFINTTGLLVTNNHVVDPAHGKSLRERQKIQYETNRLIYKIVLQSGTKDQRIVECDLIYQSMSADQALLQARDEDGNLLATPDYLQLLPNWRLQRGMNIFAFGFPGGNSLSKSRNTNAEISVSQGVVTNVPRTPSGRIRRIETNAIARPGNSGGPMVNSDGLLVGTVTLMGQAENQANQCSLVPNALTKAMVRRVIPQELLPTGSDLAPLLSFTVESQDYLMLPGLPRLADRDVLVLKNNERIYGSLDDKLIYWPSTMGDFQVQSESVAYILFGSNQHTLALEGGDTLSSTNLDVVIRFTTQGGKQLEKKSAEIRAIALRTHDLPTVQTINDVIAMTYQSDRVLMDSVQGKVKLDSVSGEMEVSLTEISRIGVNDSGDRQIVMLKGRQQITGRLGDTLFSGVHRATGKPIQFKLNRTQDAVVEVVEIGKLSSGGMTLTSVIGRENEDLYNIARLMEAGDLETARKKLQPFLPRKLQTKMSDTRKWEVRILEGVLAIRSEATDAMKKIRRCVRATDPKIAAYARGCVAVLKNYGTQYKGKPLVDPLVFAEAGAALGEQFMKDARVVLQDRKNLQGKKGEYNKYIMAIKKHEKRMEAASAFAGPDAEDVLIELWSFAVDLCGRESDRLIMEHRKILQGRRKVPLGDFHKLEKITKKYDKLTNVWKERYFKLRDYGFHYSKELDIQKLTE